MFTQNQVFFVEYTEGVLLFENGKCDFFREF